MKRGSAIVCALLVAGCAANNANIDANQVQVSAKSPDLAWQQRQQQIARLSEWRLSGRVGLQVRQQSGSFGIDWLQRRNGQYDMTIKNPLTGATVASIGSTGSQVTLKAADGKIYNDSSAERLLAKQMRLNLPLSHLRYWVQGIPAPGVAVEAIRLDQQGRPQRLQQAGWVVDYPAYRSGRFDAMPERVQLEKAAEQVKARVVVKEWQTQF